MKIILATLAAGVWMVLSSFSFAQVPDVEGDVTEACVDLIWADISADSEILTASLMLAGNFCEKAQYQFHVDTDGDNDSDFGYMAKRGRKGFTFHGSPNLEVEIDESMNSISFQIPIDELLDGQGNRNENVAVWFRSHLKSDVDLFPDKNEASLDLEIGNTVLKLIGSEGGIVVIDDESSSLNGASLAIPKGALSENVTITVSTFSESFQIPPGFIGGESPIEFGPSGTVFSEPVVFQLPLTREGYAPYYLYDEDAQSWELLHSVKNTLTNTFDVDIPHFSKINWICKRFGIFTSGCRNFDLPTIVTYTVNKHGFNITVPENEVEAEIRRALDEWETVLNNEIEFRFLPTGSADINISWDNNYDGSIARVDLLSGGRFSIRFNDTGRFQYGRYDEGGYSNLYSIFAVFLHEVGHVLGLNHLCNDGWVDSTFKKCQTGLSGPVMAPKMQDWVSFEKVDGLYGLDVSTARNLYGVSEGEVVFKDTFESYPIGHFGPGFFFPAEIGQYGGVRSEGGEIRISNYYGSNVLELIDSSTADRVGFTALPITWPEGIIGSHSIEFDVLFLENEESRFQYTYGATPSTFFVVFRSDNSISISGGGESIFADITWEVGTWYSIRLTTNSISGINELFVNDELISLDFGSTLDPFTFLGVFTKEASTGRLLVDDIEIDSF